MKRRPQAAEAWRIFGALGAYKIGLQNWPHCPGTLWHSELEATLVGEFLREWTVDTRRTKEDYDRYMDVERLLQYSISDDSPTSNYSLSKKAAFFRSLSDAFPHLIDYLSLAPQFEVNELTFLNVGKKFDKLHQLYLFFHFY